MEITVTLVKLYEAITDLEMVENINVIFDVNELDEETTEVRLLGFTCPKELLTVLGFELEQNEEEEEEYEDEVMTVNDEENESEYK